jgi:hypothetical protein
MILRQFSSNQPYLLFSIPVVLGALLLPAWQKGLSSVPASSFPLDQWMAQASLPLGATVAMAGVLLLIGALYSNYTFNRHEFYEAPTFVPGLLYALTGAALCLVQLSVAALLANLFVLGGLNALLQVYRQSRVLSEYFIGGFCFGTAALIFPPYLSLAAGLWVCVVYTRAFHWREHFLVLLSFALPFGYWIFWKFFTDKMHEAILIHLSVSFDPPLMGDWGIWSIRVFLLVLAATLLLSVVRYLFLSKRQSSKGKSVKSVFLIMSISMAAACAVLLLWRAEWLYLPLLIPVTFLCGYWYTNYRYSLLAPLAFYIYAGAIVFMAWHYYNS